MLRPLPARRIGISLNKSRGLVALTLCMPASGNVAGRSRLRSPGLHGGIIVSELAVRLPWLNSVHCMRHALPGDDRRRHRFPAKRCPRISGATTVSVQPHPRTRQSFWYHTEELAVQRMHVTPIVVDVDAYVRDADALHDATYSIRLAFVKFGTPT
jgi:hypothetical protein